MRSDQSALDARCAQCGDPIDRQRRPRSNYCTKRCQYAARDARPEVKARQREQKRARYRDDPETRERIQTRNRDRYRVRHGIPPTAAMQRTEETGR